MKTSRKFQPSSMPALEGRVVLSHVLNLTANLDNLSRPPADIAQTISPGNMVPGAPAAPTGGNTFALDISDTLKAGLPVYEQKQTIYSNDVTDQVVDELIVPNPGGGTTTTEWISLKDNGGDEKVVDVKTVANGATTDQITTNLPNGTVRTEVDSAVTSGNTTTHTNIITTLPDGKVQTNTYTDVQKGPRELIKNGSEPAPNGSVETYSGVKYTVGGKTYTYKTFDQPAGLVKHTESVVTNLGDSGQNTTNMTTKAHSHETITNNIVIVSRLNPPTS